ncbi:MAG TPA: glycosyltransferase [Planctomycetota bacterium]|nr:glycosyltransferase [Planctomycetota bacterium]
MTTSPTLRPQKPVDGRPGSAAGAAGAAGAAHPDITVAEFLRKHRDECAATVLTRGQMVRYGLLAALILTGVLYWYVWIDVFNFVICAVYGVIIFYKLLTVCLAAAKRREIVVGPGDLSVLKDEELPVYTVLVPMYKEAGVAAKLLRAVGCLDYPADKLDVKILLEADDPDTIAACRAMKLPFPVEILVVPDVKPKTKPRACNWGLATARGEYLVIYDAEDRPEPDQLKKAVVAFRWQPPEVACLQAKLNYYNPRQNWLTRFFTLEYTAWFDLYLPGLHALNVPIPLGGTSNHFRTAALKELGGWDPYNVTEDCDLGVRIERAGYRTRILESTTWEEANSRLGNWIKQRSRWVKGYVQTHLVHTRRRLATMRGMGLKNYLSFLLTVGGLPAVLLLNPLYWLVGLLFIFNIGHDSAGWHWQFGWRMWYDDVGRAGDPTGNIYQHFWWSLTGQQGCRFGDILNIPWGNWPSQIFFPIAISLLVSNLFLIGVHMLACRRRGLWDLAPWALLIPFYWMLISVGAWKGFLQLITRPFYWEKTQHGLTAAEPPECAPGPVPGGRG